MSITVLQVKTSVQARGYGTDTTAAQLEMVKSALRRVYNERRWRFLQKQDSSLSLTAGVGTKSLSTLTGLTHVDAVRISIGTEFYDLDFMPYERLRDLDFRDHLTNDNPTYWTLADANTLQVWPRPDRAYLLTVDYVYLPPMPAADGDALVFPDEHLDVLSWAACEEMAYRQRDWTAADRARARYDDGILKMIRAFGFTQRQTDATVVRWDGWDQGY